MQEVRQQMQTKFSAEYEVDLMISYVLTVNINVFFRVYSNAIFSNKDNGSANRSITATLLLTTAMQLQIVIMVGGVRYRINIFKFCLVLLWMENS